MPQQNKQNYITYFSFSFLNNFTVGSYLVLVGWQAAEISTGAGLVGRVFMIASICSIFLGPIIGQCVDLVERRFLVVVAQLTKVILGILPLVLSHYFAVPSSQYLLYLLVAISSVSSSLSALSINPIIRQEFSGSGITKVISRLSIMREGGIVTGSVTAGVVMYYLPFEVAFCMVAIAALPTVFIARLYPVCKPEKSEQKLSISLLPKAFSITTVLREKRIRYYAGITIILTGLAAFINTLLPEYIETVRQGNSTFYGNVEAIWSLGGVFAGYILARFPKFQLQPEKDPTLVALGLMTLCTPLIENDYAFLAWHFLIGMFSSYGFVISSAAITRHCNKAVLGSFNANTRSLGSMLSIVIYLLPSWYTYDNYEEIYLLGGILLAATGLISLLAFYVFPRGYLFNPTKK